MRTALIVIIVANALFLGRHVFLSAGNTTTAVKREMQHQGRLFSLEVQRLV